MNNRPLTTQFRMTLVWIVAATIIATVVTYGLAVLLYITVGYQSVHPANYHEQQIPVLEDYVREENTSLLSENKDREFKRMIEDREIGYQVMDETGNVLYGNEEDELFTTAQEMNQNLNTTFGNGHEYVYTVPIINNEAGNVEGAVAFSYPLKVTGNSWMTAVFTGALLSPFVYIIGFTLFFSRRFVKNIRQPLELLMQACQSIKKKDLDFDIPYHSNNELGKLRDAFSEMQEELKTSLSAQWAMEQERVEMTEALAHDLKAPMSVIKGYSEALIRSEDATLDYKTMKYLQTIKEYTEKSTSLVEQMQYIAHLENVGETASSSMIDLKSVIQEKLKDYELQALPQNIKMNLEITDHLPEKVRIDSEKLTRILDNIISNSLRYTPKDGNIHITVNADTEYVYYKICDSGSGFTPKDLEKGLERFYRGDESRNSKDGHSGLGLYIVKKLVEQLGGNTKIYNGARGACVEFCHRLN
jgi:signal transduction histidine kinase